MFRAHAAHLFSPHPGTDHGAKATLPTGARHETGDSPAEGDGGALERAGPQKQGRPIRSANAPATEVGEGRRVAASARPRASTGRTPFAARG
jgi:hypothetical protein